MENSNKQMTKKRIRKKCPHGKRKDSCIECSPCPHNKLKRNCAECNPCPHNKLKRDCAECNPCPHNKLKSDCAECNPCPHGNHKSRCTEGTCAFIRPSSKCIACRSKLVNRTPGVPSTHMCAECRAEYDVQRIKVFEQQMQGWLDEANIHWSHSNKKLPCAPTTRYPDYLFVAGNHHAVLLEVDEHEHQNYVAKCEIARISEFMDSIDHKSLHVIRYNPHAPGSTDEKKKTIINTIREAVTTNFGSFNDSGCVVQYVGYSNDRIIQLEKLSCELQKYD